MRTIISGLSVSFAVMALSACAGGPAGEHSYRAEMERLERDCRARDGILVPTGVGSGRAAGDYACEIRNPTRIEPRS